MSEPTSDERELLALTLDQHRIKRRVDLLRARIDEKIRAEWTEKGHAPTWKYRGLGQIRLDGCDAEEKPYVRDPDVVASYIAERWPTEATATITIADVTVLEDALDALRLIGIDAQATLTARTHQVERVLKDAVRHENEDGTVEVFNTDGEPLPGIGFRAGGAPTLKVVIDRPVKSAAEAEVDEQFLEEHPAPEATDSDVDDVAKGA